MVLTSHSDANEPIECLLCYWSERNHLIPTLHAPHDRSKHPELSRVANFPHSLSKLSKESIARSAKNYDFQLPRANQRETLRGTGPGGGETQK
jgi:hypothetical protein